MVGVLLMVCSWLLLIMGVMEVITGVNLSTESA